MSWGCVSVRSITGALLGVLLLGAPLLVAAATTGETRTLLREYLVQRESDPEGWRALLKEAKDRASFCARCHGTDGVSVLPLIPNLAGQNPYYLLQQIERFADGQRKDFIMTPLAAQAKPAERALLAVYYSTLAPRAAPADPGLAASGKRRYEQSCITCHGLDGRGTEVYSRLAGQQAGYLRHRLLALRAASATPGSVMPEIARTLTDDDIDALIAYLSSQP